MTWKPHRKRIYTETIQPLNPTFYVKAISFSGLCASLIGARFDQTRIRRLSSARPNPESSFTFLFVTLLERIDEKVNVTFQDICACISEVWLSVYSKIHESCKSEVKPQIKVVIVQQSAALRASFTIFTSRASQFRSIPFLNRCGFAVYKTSKPYRFENAPPLKAYSKRHGSDNELDRRRVNERRNRIETDAVTNETASV